MSLPDFEEKGPYNAMTQRAITTEEFVTRYARYWRWDSLTEFRPAPTGPIGVSIGWTFTDRVSLIVELVDWHLPKPSRPPTDDLTRRIPIYLQPLRPPRVWLQSQPNRTHSRDFTTVESPWTFRGVPLRALATQQRGRFGARYFNRIWAVADMLLEPEATENLQAEVNAMAARCLAEGATIV